MRLLLSTSLLLALSVEAFQFQPSTLRPGQLTSTTCTSSSSSALYNTHQFNGGYDASDVQSSAKWSPREASEFVIWHMSDDYEEVGRQLSPLIPNWSGKDLGEFLTRLYLGETTEDFEISFESRNVRTPQWRGLDTPQGIDCLKDLLRTALPDDLLKEPIDMASVAQVFLWKEHTWPVQVIDGTSSKDSDKKQLERDSFASRGYTGIIVQVWMELREERGRKRNFLYSADDVLQMVPAPSQKDNDWGAIQLRGMQEFFVQMGIRLAPSCKVELVQGMASGGWNPGKIAKFVSNIPEIAEDVKKIRASAALEQEEKRVVVEEEEEPVMLEAPPPPMEKSHLDNVTSYTKYLKECEDGDEGMNNNSDKIELPAPSASSGGVKEVLEAVRKTQEYFDDTIKPAQNDALAAVRKKIEASKQRSAPWQ